MTVTFATLTVGGKDFAYYDLAKAGDVSRLPFSMKVLLENLLRNEDGVSVSEADLKAVALWARKSGLEIADNATRIDALLTDHNLGPATTIQLLDTPAVPEDVHFGSFR